MYNTDSPPPHQKNPQAFVKAQTPGHLKHQLLVVVDEKAHSFVQKLTNPPACAALPCAFWVKYDQNYGHCSTLPFLGKNDSPAKTKVGGASDTNRKVSLLARNASLWFLISYGRHL
jgi:hypothetical protein